MFAEMLDMAGYSQRDQYTHLHVFPKSIVSFLGDRWMSILTRYRTTFKLSLNCNDSVVRYTYEPINDATGTAADPFNTNAIWEALKQLIALDPTVDTEYFCHFKRDLTLNPSEADLLRDSQLARSDIMTQTKLALNLKADGRFLIFDSVRSLAPGQPNVTAALGVLEDYVDSRAHEGTVQARLLSCDLVEPAKSRIQIYVSEQVVSLAAMSDMWTLRGRRNDPTTQAGLMLIHELWDLLRVPEGLRSYTKGYMPLGSMPDKDELLPGMANYTLHPDCLSPEPQVYFSVFGMKDKEIADALTIFFERHGWHDMAKKYQDSNLPLSLSPDEQHDSMNYIHAYISFSYRKNKPYLGVYLQSFETGDWPSGKHDPIHHSLLH
ncbi:4-dimethylallyl tryptophan synthase [Microdochium trichocladiopsis]|uniref:4-dimethylallyl tryptophan synthase n=1 Tax=Microdochium trichocladiopsis TaxID=1682393 RepID=A0A9P8Y3F8_9PEZI|nr:4-dimethylallyl tryptophan synthase [Microdochium trichocladiopsis]KAH7028981.1 4-dimethylallyl tryptophan synthase [Microdochium trichocladiopsis]